MAKMYSFLEDMKKYIVDGLNADADISDTYGIVAYSNKNRNTVPNNG